jgi:GntR family transcriptional regulator
MLPNLRDLPSLEKDTYTPLYAQLSNIIENYIKTNQLQPGDPLPSESDLIQHYNVSRMTVRIGFQRLATAGLIKKVQGKGTFVAEPKIKAQLRGGLSIEESLADQGFTINSELLEASVFHEPIQLFLDELGLPSGGSAFKLIMLKKVGQIPIGVEIRYLPVEIASRFQTKDFENQLILNLLNSHPETEVHRIKYRVTGESLLERYTDFLNVPDGSLGLVQFETHYNYKDKAIMTGKMILLAEQVEMTYEIRKETDIWVNQKIYHGLRNLSARNIID